MTLLLCAIFLLANPPPPTSEPVQTGQFTLRFEKFHPLASKNESQKRFRWKDSPADINPTDETYGVYVPADYAPDGTYGVLVWISPSDSGAMWQPWKDVLDKHKLIWIGANKAPNGRHADHRIRLAVEGALIIQDQYRIDPNRVYAAGMSGGGKITDMVAMHYADVFTGGFSICGVNFYRNIPVPHEKNKAYPQEFYPPAGKIVKLMKERSRHVLLTGTEDFNLEPTQQIHDLGYKQDKFRNVTLLIVPGLAHDLPDAEWFEKGIVALDTPPATPGKPAPPAPKSNAPKNLPTSRPRG